jgi:hypothetical protein
MRSCGHKLSIECDTDVDTVMCTERCQLLLPCGHQCQDKCGKTCGVKRCTERVTNPFDSPCGHTFEIPCYIANAGNEINPFLFLFRSLISSSFIVDKEYAIDKYCEEPCGKILKECEHSCVGKCGICRGRLHAPCGQPCGNVLICGHV